MAILKYISEITGHVRLCFVRHTQKYIIRNRERNQSHNYNHVGKLEVDHVILIKSVKALYLGDLNEVPNRQKYRLATRGTINHGGC